MKKFKKFVLRITGINAIRCYLEERRRQKAVHDQWLVDQHEKRRKELLAAEERERIPERIDSILALPVLKLTLERFEEIPKGEGMDLNTCPLYTWFLCIPCEYLPEVIVVGHVVPIMEAIARQYGAGLSLPKRFANRYRVEIVETVAEESPLASSVVNLVA